MLANVLESRMERCTALLLTNTVSYSLSMPKACSWSFVAISSMNEPEGLRNHVQLMRHS